MNDSKKLLHPVAHIAAHFTSSDVRLILYYILNILSEINKVHCESLHHRSVCVCVCVCLPLGPPEEIGDRKSVV